MHTEKKLLRCENIHTEHDNNIICCLFPPTGKISKASSLFTYDTKYLLDSYYFPPSHDAAFVPAFSLPERPDHPLVADMLSMCRGEGAHFCKYDTLITQSLAEGKATLRAYQSHQALMEALKPGTASIQASICCLL